MIPMIRVSNKEGRQEMDLFSYEFTYRRVIRLTGEITNELADRVRAQLAYLDTISQKEITIWINSPGGSVTAGMSILDAMKEAQSEIRTIVCGMAASMGAFLAACGGTPGKRGIEPSAELLIHQPLGGAYGQASDVELAAEHIRKVKGKMNTWLSQCTGQSLDQIAKDTDRDYYLDAMEALEYGLVDYIVQGVPEDVK